MEIPTHRSPRDVGQRDAEEPAPGSPDEQGRDKDTSGHCQPVGPAGQEKVDKGEEAEGHGVVGT